MAAGFVLFCNPESRRVEGFCGALGRVLRQRPLLLPWQRLLEGGFDVLDHKTFGPPRPFLRLESPGRNWTVERQLLVKGAATRDEEAEREWRRIGLAGIVGLVNEPGRVLRLRQWFRGWRKTLEDLANWARQKNLESRWLCPPEDVIRMFDKAACQRDLEQAGIPVPPALGVPRHFDELMDMMRRTGRRRVFLKPCHGSSASGVVALESTRRDLQAFSAVELADGGLELYNRRRIRTWRGAQEVRNLVDLVCAERCLAEVWIPKAGLNGKPFDVRVVVIAGRARHVMVRLGRGPITNSQLLGGKAYAAELRRRMGEGAWAQMLAVCERAMAACFPRSLYAGLDVLVEPDFRTVRILEVNAFGDLLPRILHEGRDTYEWEVIEALRREEKIQ